MLIVTGALIATLAMILAIAVMCLPLASTVGCDEEPEIREQEHIEIHDLPVEQRTIVE